MVVVDSVVVPPVRLSVAPLVAVVASAPPEMTKLGVIKPETFSVALFAVADAETTPAVFVVVAPELAAIVIVSIPAAATSVAFTVGVDVLFVRFTVIASLEPVELARLNVRGQV